MQDWGNDLAKKMEEILFRLEGLRLSEYLAYVGDRRRMLRSHFLAGVARGLGTAVGFTILGAVLVAILQRLAQENLPVIGDFLARIVTLVQRRLE